MSDKAFFVQTFPWSVTSKRLLTTGFRGKSEGVGLCGDGWGYMWMGGATVCLHHCPSTGQGCRRNPGDHCHTGARCVTLQTTNRQERDTSSVNSRFTGSNQTRRSSDTAGRKHDTQSVQVQTLKRPLTDLLVSHRSPQVSVFI